MAYVYRHIRLDKNEPFYIGIGSPQQDFKYKSATRTTSRNIIWKRIVKHCINYDVEIIVDDLTWDEACKKEIEFIGLYGRIIDGGILANITKGGDGSFGVKRSAHAIMATTLKNTGKKRTPETCALIRANKTTPANIGQWNRGKIRTKENRDKISNTLRKRDDTKGEHHSMAKLNTMQVLQMRKEYGNRDCSRKEFGNRYGVTEGCVKDIIYKRSWRHIL